MEERKMSKEIAYDASKSCKVHYLKGARV